MREKGPPPRVPMHKALFLKEPKGDFYLDDAVTYDPEYKELRTENIAVAENPVDWKQREYNFFIPEVSYSVQYANQIVSLHPW
jgi:hypothetical protein